MAVEMRAPNGASVDAYDGHVDALIAAGFVRIEEEKVTKPATRRRTAKSKTKE